MTSHSDAAATDDNRAVAGTVATVGDGVGDGAVATATDGTVTVANTDTVINGTAAVNSASR